MFLKSKKNTEKYLWKSWCLCLFFKDFALFLPIFLKFKNSYFQGTTLFFSIKTWRFCNRKLNVLDQIKTRFSLWLKTKIRKMASNKHVDLRKIENVVRSKGKTANFWKPCKNFKIVDEILRYKGKRWVIFDNYRKFLPVYKKV